MNGQIFQPNFLSNSTQGLVHHKIKQLGFFKASNYHFNQVVVKTSLESATALDSHKDVRNFLQTHSKFGKNVS
jgi:hypothetical protein